MHEIELKFQVPTGRRAAVDAAVAGRDGAPRVRLQAAYFDTAERTLAEAGFALRIRREGRRRVQTLKAAGDDGLTRAEHNVVLPGQHDTDAVADPALHAGTEVGQRLRELLDKQPGAALQCLFRTNILRRSRQVRTRHGLVELAFDDGAIVAGEQRLPVCELEIELVSGSPLAVLTTARSWVRRHGVWLDTRSKAERGDMLARGEAMAAACAAQTLQLDEAMTPAQGVRCVLLSCLQQISVNASQVAAGSYDAEHVHQLRIGLRRLRTALRLFEPMLAQWPAMVEIGEHAATLFRALGASRDMVAIAQPMQRELGAALHVAGLRFEAPALPVPADAAEPAALVRSQRMQTLLLDLFEATQGDAPLAAQDTTLRDGIAEQLARWHRKARADCKRFATLDDAMRHRLRKRVKRLRYAVEFASGLFEHRRVRRYLKPLRALQERLGALVDVTVAIDAYRRSSDDDPHALFAVGWLAARKDTLLHDSAPDLEAFVEVKRFWKKG